MNDLDTQSTVSVTYACGHAVQFPASQPRLNAIRSQAHWLLCPDCTHVREQARRPIFS